MLTTRNIINLLFVVYAALLLGLIGAGSAPQSPKEERVNVYTQANPSEAQWRFTEAR